MTLVSALFRQFGICFFTLQDKYNICALSENIKFICTRCETGQILHVSKALHINFIFSDNVFIFFYIIHKIHKIRYNSKYWSINLCNLQKYKYMFSVQNETKLQ